jgi:hypothetical protein
MRPRAYRRPESVSGSRDEPDAHEERTENRSIADGYKRPRDGRGFRGPLEAPIRDEFRTILKVGKIIASEKVKHRAVFAIFLRQIPLPAKIYQKAVRKKEAQVKRSVITETAPQRPRLTADL